MIDPTSRPHIGSKPSPAGDGFEPSENKPLKFLVFSVSPNSYTTPSSGPPTPG